MLNQASSEHLILISNINFNVDLKSFYEFVSTFGQISLYQESIKKNGLCFVCYYDSRCARKALSSINSNSDKMSANYSWIDTFPIQKLSSSLLVSCNKDLIDFGEFTQFFSQYGDIKNISINDDNVSAKLVYYDIKSSIKVCEANLDKYKIEIINSFNISNDSVFSQNNSDMKYKMLYEREIQKNTEMSVNHHDLLIRNQKLEDEILFLKRRSSDEKHNDSLKISKYEHKYSNLTREIKRLKRHESPNKKTKSGSDKPNFDSQKVFPDFHEDESILAELDQLEKIEPKSRKYSEKIYEYSFSLYLYSAKSFRFIRQTFPFPSVSSLYYHFGEEMNHNKEYICHIRYSTYLVESYKEIFNIDDQTPIIISGDATVATANPMFRPVSDKKYLYLYQMNSLFPDTPVLPMYLKLNTSSKFKSENLIDMMNLKDILEELNLFCLAISTDGDNGVDHYHEDVFESYDQITNESNEVIIEPRIGHPIVDLMHVLKAQHAKFFRQNLALGPNSPIFDIALIQSLTSRGRCFTEMNDTIRYKDEYGIDFFSPASFLDVIQHEEIIIFSYYLLPFILWQCAIRYKNLSNQRRIYLLNLTFLIFKKEYDDFHEKNIENHFYLTNVDNCEKLSCYTKPDLIKYMNTLIVDIHAIKKYGYLFIALNRLGNYTIEKTFGNTREYMNNSIDDELFKNVLVHQVLRKEMNEALEIKTTKSHPNEKGGVIISQDTPDFFEIDSEQIYKEIVNLRNAAFSSDFSIRADDLANLQSLMENLMNDPNSNDTIPQNESSTSSEQIPMRWGIPINTH